MIDPLLLSSLDFGEASVLNLAIRKESAFLLIDERKARQIARTVYGLDVIGTIRILIDAKKMGFITNISELIEQMRANGYWIHGSIIEYALQVAGE